MKVRVELAMMIRHVKTVTVRVPVDFPSWDTSRFMSTLYDMDDGGGFEEDSDAGAEEGTHTLLSEENDDDGEVDFIATEEDEIEFVGANSAEMPTLTDDDLRKLMPRRYTQVYADEKEVLMCMRLAIKAAMEK